MNDKLAYEKNKRRIFMSKYEQAIKLLEMLSSDEFQQFTSSEFDDAIYTAIEALKKQTPKKPINLTCPNCGSIWLLGKQFCGFDKIDNSWWVFTYCPKCGQLLDWEEIE